MGIRDNIRSMLENIGPTRRLAGDFLSSVKEEGFDLNAVIKPPALHEQAAAQAAARKSASEATSAQAKPTKDKDGKAWYLDGQEDLDGWEDTNANDAKKAEARESAERNAERQDEQDR